MKWGGNLWVSPRCIMLLFESWNQAVAKYVPREAWQTLFAAVNWSLWNHRSRMIFNQASFQTEDLWCSIRKHAKEWVL